jgi:hypothetical protein
LVSILPYYTEKGDEKNRGYSNYDKIWAKLGKVDSSRQKNLIVGARR